MNFIKSVFEKVNKDGHVPIAIFIFITGSAIHVLHGLDASFVSFTTTILAFLGGHAYLQSGGDTDAK